MNKLLRYKNTISLAAILHRRTAVLADGPKKASDSPDFIFERLVGFVRHKLKGRA